MKDDLLKDTSMMGALNLYEHIQDIIAEPDPVEAIRRIADIIEAAIEAYRDYTLRDVEAKLRWLSGGQHKPRLDGPSVN